MNKFRITVGRIQYFCQVLGEYRLVQVNAAPGDRLRSYLEKKRMYKHRIYKGTCLKIYLGVSASIFRVKVPAWRIVTMSGTEFGATFSRSDVIVWVSKSRFTHPTIIKMPGAVRSFGRRAFYNSTPQKYWLSVGTQIWLCTSTYRLPIWGNMSYSVPSRKKRNRQIPSIFCRRYPMVLCTIQTWLWAPKEN